MKRIDFKKVALAILASMPLVSPARAQSVNAQAQYNLYYNAERDAEPVSHMRHHGRIHAVQNHDIICDTRNGHLYKATSISHDHEKSFGPVIATIPEDKTVFIETLVGPENVQSNMDMLNLSKAERRNVQEKCLGGPAVS